MSKKLCYSKGLKTWYFVMNHIVSQKDEIYILVEFWKRYKSQLSKMGSEAVLQSKILHLFFLLGL